MTKLEAGSLVGISEVDAVKYFLNSHDITSIEYVPFDDGWDPEKIPEVYKEVRAQGINIIITSHTSTCALELKKLTDEEQDEVLVLVTGSTTDQLTGIIDNNIRFVQDVSMEQTSMADRIMEGITRYHSDALGSELILLKPISEVYRIVNTIKEFFPLYFILVVLISFGKIAM